MEPRPYSAHCCCCCCRFWNWSFWRRWSRL